MDTLKDHLSPSKDYSHVSRQYPGLSNHYASLPKEDMSRGYAKIHIAGGLMKASDYPAQLRAAPLRDDDFNTFSDLNLSKPSLGDNKPGSIQFLESCDPRRQIPVKKDRPNK